jgi:tRNA G18 (ribose-2'-O)-methylase SpoU
MEHNFPERYFVNLSDTHSNKNKTPNVYSAWERDRNVIDDFKNLSNEEIKLKVEQQRLPYAILMTHINIDYNLGAVLRIGNCLGAKVYYYGKKKWDKRSATGAWYYSPITYLKNIEEVENLKKDYAFVALEQTKSSISLTKFVWPNNKKSLIVVGEESLGLQATPEIFKLSDYFVEINQRGSVRSLNAASSVSMACYDFIYKNNYSILIIICQ